MVYNLLYKQIVSRLPDRLVESSGGSFMEIVSIFQNHQNKINLPFKIKNFEFSNPVGIPSGWADTPRKMHLMYKLGCGIVISKTITPEPRKGNPYPRLIRGSDYLINSMGLPNKGVNWWSKNLDNSKFDNVILSIRGNTFKEWEILIENLEHKTDIFELNFSCPNLDNGVMNLQESKKAIEDISSITDKPIWLKLSPEFSPKENLEFTKAVIDEILGISLINTVPVRNEKLGQKDKRGGMSGPKIFDNLILFLSNFRNEYPNFNELPIFATGGIDSGMKAWTILSQYKAIPLGLTGFLMHGPNYFINNLKYIQNMMDQSEITLINEIIN